MSRLNRLRESKFVRDTLVLQAGRIGTTALSFISFWLIIRLMGVEAYGVWKLVLAFVGIWQALDITGIGQLTSTRLAIAVGRKDSADTLDLMAVYVKVVLVWALISVVVLFALGPLVSAQLYEGNRTIGALAGWYALSIAADTLYTLVIVALQSRRLMRQLALLQNLNQIVLFACIVAAVLVSPTPEALLVGRLVYSYSTMALAFYLYSRLRHEAGVSDIPEVDQDVPDAAAHAGGCDGETYHRVGDGIGVAVPQGSFGSLHCFKAKLRRAQWNFDRALEAFLHFRIAPGLLLGGARGKPARIHVRTEGKRILVHCQHQRVFHALCVFGGGQQLLLGCFAAGLALG